MTYKGITVNSGTKHYEVQKPTVYAGAKHHDVGKVTVNDGTTQHEVWKAEQPILIKNNYFNDVTGGYVGGTNPNGAYQNGKLVSTGIELACSSNINKTLWTNKKIDFTPYNKMRVKVTVTNARTQAGNNRARGYAVLLNDSKSYTYNAPDGYSGEAKWGTKYQFAKYMQQISGNEGTTENDVNNGVKNFIFNIENVKGSYYLAVLSACGASANTITATFNEIILE